MGLKGFLGPVDDFSSGPAGRQKHMMAMGV